MQPTIGASSVAVRWWGRLRAVCSRWLKLASHCCDHSLLATCI